MKAKWMRWMLNGYPPYWGTGIWIREISDDYRHAEVAMHQRFYNRNYFGTHFGGSLYAMVDPLYALMFAGILGPRYQVWDETANVRFVRPGVGTVTATFAIDDQLLQQVMAATADGEAWRCELPVLILDGQQRTVATVDKGLYFRKKRPKSPS